MIKNFILWCSMVPVLAFSQVGINTTAPRGVLDIVSPDQNQGMVLPSVTKVEDIINLQTNDRDVPPGTIAFDLSRNSICLLYGNNWKCTNVDGVVTLVSALPPKLSSDYTYVKPSNTNANTQFGYSVSLSNNGELMAVGSPYEDVYDNNRNIQLNAGAVYIYKRTGNDWVQEAYITATNPYQDYEFGSYVSFSGDGSLLAISSMNDKSNTKVINGDETNQSLLNAGAVHLFKRTQGVWSKEAYIKPKNTKSTIFFGKSISLSYDGTTLAVSGSGENSGSTGINGNGNDTSMEWSGAAYVFRKTNNTWQQEAYIKSNYVRGWRYFGESVSLSSDGNILAVGSVGDKSSGSTEGVGNMDHSGAAYIFKRTGTVWSQNAFIKPSRPKDKGYFGTLVALSSDGSTLAVSSDGESSSAKGVNGNENNTSMQFSGAVYVFKYNGNKYVQEAYIKASNTKSEFNFGKHLAMSSNGSILAVGSVKESSKAIGIDGDQDNNQMPNAGAVYVYKRKDSTWTQESYLKASNTRQNAYFGRGISMSGNGNILAIGSSGESSNAIGIDGNQDNNQMPNAGAVYISTRK